MEMERLAPAALGAWFVTLLVAMAGARNFPHACRSMGYADPAYSRTPRGVDSTNPEQSAVARFMPRVFAAHGASGMKEVRDGKSIRRSHES